MGDLVVVTAQDDYRVGDLVVFDAPVAGPRGEASVVHRIVDVDADGRMSTKGDNNYYRDAWTIGTDDIVGKFRLRIPHFSVVHGLFTKLFHPAVIGALVGVFAFLMIATDDDEEPDGEGSGPADGADASGDDAVRDGADPAGAIIDEPEPVPVGTARSGGEPSIAAHPARRTIRAAVAAAVVIGALAGGATSVSAAELAVKAAAMSVWRFTCPTPTTCHKI